MRRPTRTASLCCAALAASLTLAACGTSPSQRRPVNYPETASSPEQAPDRQQQTQADNNQPPSPEQMQQLLARLESLEVDNAQLRRRVSDQYMQAIAQRQAEMEAEGSGQPTANGGADADTQQGVANTGSEQPAPSAEGLSRIELLDALVNEIVEGEDPQRVKALMVAAISVASESHELDHTLLDQLDPRSREQVARFQQMLAVTFDELADASGEGLTRREMIERVDEVFGAQPLSIEALELCRRVDGYGVYTPFDNTRFLAGRVNRVLVYVELENFQHQLNEQGRYEVRLEQSVELFDSTGETTVWRQGPVELVDVSRNQRRDFFIVYPIDLPARLTAGSYRLKVRVADLHTGSICEQTLHDIQIVVDQSLVGGQ